MNSDFISVSFLQQLHDYSIHIPKTLVTVQENQGSVTVTLPECDSYLSTSQLSSFPPNVLGVIFAERE
jgi:hypothetical protein